jgi:hypothetical protein
MVPCPSIASPPPSARLPKKQQTFSHPSAPRFHGRRARIRTRIPQTPHWLLHNLLVAFDSIHTVFISSTFEDLREERAEVQKAVLRLKCLPIGMELFPSADDDAWGFIKGEIERCDYYVLIVGGRYGSVDKDGVSYTEKEYRFAVELNKPRLVFIRRNRDGLSPERREQDRDKHFKLDKFIHELEGARLAQAFESHHQLGGDAYYSLNYAIAALCQVM